MLIRQWNWTRLQVKATLYHEHFQQRESGQEIQQPFDWYPRDATFLILVVVVSMDHKGGAANARILQLP